MLALRAVNLTLGSNYTLDEMQAMDEWDIDRIMLLANAMAEKK